MQTTSEQWEKVKTLFELALALQADEREKLLSRECPDPELRARVYELLRNHELAGDFLNQPTLNSILYTGDGKLEEDETDDFPSVINGDKHLRNLVGQRFGAYVLVRLIGSGGMADVYLSERADDAYRKQVAIKLIRPGLDSEEILARFRNERQTLAALDHPNIVKLLDGGSEAGTPYLVMDYVNGLPVDKYCDLQQQSVDERLRLFCTICDAVQHAHEHHVLHRDLKPSNILVTAEGSPRLLDFGISKVLVPSDDSHPQTVTQTLMRRLTPAYASPEQVRGESLTPATDIYSLGVILYELLTGHRPYRVKQSTPAEIEKAICEQEPENPSTAVERVEVETARDGLVITKTPELVSQSRASEPQKLRRRLCGDLDNIVLMALSKEPQRRYASARELSDDINRHLNRLPVKARSSTKLYRIAKFVARHKPEVIAAMSVLLVLIAAGAFSIWTTKHVAEQAQMGLMQQGAGNRPSLAVVGFKNLSGQPDLDWLSLALTEMLSTELSSGGRLRIIPESDVTKTKINLSLTGSEVLGAETLLKLRKNLSTDFVISGSYLGNVAERQLRLDLKLQDARSGQNVDAFAVNGSESDIAALVSRAGVMLRTELGIPRISATDSTIAEGPLWTNALAARLYIEGLARQRSFDPLGAQGLFERAAQLDPKSPLIHAALSDNFNSLGYEIKAQAEAKKAVALSSTLPREQALSLQAHLYQITNESEKAVEAYRSLLRFFPDSVDYGLQLADAQTEVGKLDDATNTLQSLRRLPSPSNEDPRIDLAEANTARARSDTKAVLAAAKQAEQKGNALGARLLVADALVVQAYAYRRLSKRDESIAAAKQAKQIYAAIGNRRGEANALSRIASVLEDENDLEGAKSALKEALAIRHVIGDKSGEASTLGNIATVQNFGKEFSASIDSYKRSLELSRELGEPRQISITLHNLGVAEKDIGRYREASEYFQEALPAARKYGDKGLIAGCLLNLADVYAAQGRTAEAQKMDEEMLSIFRGTGDKMDVGGGLMQLASVEMIAGNLLPAKEHYSEALKILTDAGERAGSAYATGGLASILMAENHLSEARKHYEDVAALQKQLHSNSRYAFDTQIRLGELSVEEGHSKDAEAIVRRALSNYDSRHEVDARVAADLVLIRAFLAEGKIAQARQVMENDQKLLENSENKFIRVRAGIADAEILTHSHEAAQATRILREMLNQARGSFNGLELEARLALAKAEIDAGDEGAGRTDLISLAEDASSKDYLLVANRAKGVVSKPAFQKQ